MSTASAPRRGGALDVLARPCMPLSATATIPPGTVASSSQADTDVDAESVEVPAVDPHDVGSGLERPVQLGRRVHLHQCVEPHRASANVSRAPEPLGSERANDEQHRRGARRTRLHDLKLVENEVLSQYRDRDHAAAAAEVGDRAAEEGAVGEDRDGGRSLPRVQVPRARRAPGRL